MPHIPPDIWLYISDFLPDSTLQYLLTVNSTFFNVAINIRYREVIVNDLGSRLTTKKLLRLKDPYVAKRVRRLNLYLESNYEFFLNWKDRYCSKRSRWKRLVHKISGKPQGARTALEKVIQDLTELVLGLPNVVALHVCARELRLHECSGPVFAAAWQTFGANLHTISLQGSIEYFRHPLSLTDFTQLRELRLEFTDISCMHSAPFVNEILCDTIIPAINRFCPVLENLSLSFGLYTWGHLDLSDFLKLLDPIPRLNTLMVQVPPHKLGDPTGLIRILHDHSATLRHVRLNLDCYNLALLPGSDDRLQSLVANFLSDQTIFVNLQSFEFSPTTRSLLDDVTTYLRRSADTLTSLTILDRFLSYEQVATLTSIFRHRPANLGLRTLVLNVQFFGPRLLKLLATTLPGLRRLRLCTFNWGIDEFDLIRPAEYTKTDAFRMEMILHKDIFASWGLRDMTVMLGGGHYPPHWPRNIPLSAVRVLAECLPSVQNFGGPEGWRHMC